MATQLQQHLVEVTQLTRGLASARAPGGEASARASGGEASVRAPVAPGDAIDRFVIPVPKVRQLVQAGYSFLNESPAQVLASWDYIWHHSAHYEVMSQALYFYQHRELNRTQTRVLLQWVERCTCWEHSDDLSKIYAGVVETNPGWIVPRLKKWNRSTNPWLRRQSMVSLIEYASKRQQFLPFAELIAFIEPLLDDADYYVQKGLGWTIREIGVAYPARTMRFLEQHAGRLAPQAWTGATKNLGKIEKNRLLAIRKQQR